MVYSFNDILWFLSVILSYFINNPNDASIHFSVDFLSFPKQKQGGVGIDVRTEVSLLSLV